MSGWTNKGKYKCMGIWLRNETAPTTFYLALFLATSTFDQDVNTISDVNEIAAGNGYITGGKAVARSAAGFDVWTEDDTNDWGFVQLADVVWTASGGPIPSSGNGARYCALVDDNGTVSLREIYGFGDLSSDQSVSSGQTLTLQNFEFRLTE